MVNHSGYEPLIITGPPRSGTTLLYNLLDSHPQIFCMVSEGYLFEYLYAFRSTGYEAFIEAAGSCTLGSLVEGIRDKDVMPPLYQDYVQSAAQGSRSEFRLSIPWNEERFRENLGLSHREGWRNVDDFWRCLVASYAAAIGEDQKKPFACLKSPDYGKSAVSSTEAIPAARSIIMVRDPIRMLDSLKASREMRGVKRLTWPLFAECVMQLNDMATRFREADHSRVTFVIYEELVSDPHRVMAGLSEWIGIDFLPCLMEPTVLGTPWPGHSSFKPTTGIEPSPATRPVMTLDRHEIQYARERLTPYYETFGIDTGELDGQD